MSVWCSKHGQYLESCTVCSDEFFNGFEPKTMKIDPIGPTAKLRERIHILEQAVLVSIVVMEENGLPRAALALRAALLDRSAAKEEQ